MRGQGDLRPLSIALLPNLSENQVSLQCWFSSTLANDSSAWGVSEVLVLQGRKAGLP